MNRNVILVLLSLGVACGPPGLQADSGATTTTTTTSSDSTETSTSTSTSDSSTTSDPSTTSDSSDSLDTGFVPMSDTKLLAECDPFLQDCPEGEKCVPYSSTGGNWDANKCVPIMGDQATGEPCTWGGIIEATDDCDATGFCWDTIEVDGKLVGTCVAFCTGTADMPECPPDSYCMLSSEGSIIPCIPFCDPVVQDCVEGKACYWISAGFSCIFTSRDFPPGAPCGYINDCAEGSVCADASALPTCNGSGCCTPYCDLGLGDAQCAAVPGTVCVSFFEEGMAPDGYEHVGVCILP